MGCCYTTSNRRIPNGNIHCELDVESADSGRGASEDDPSQLGGQFMHFYPTCHVSSVPQQSLMHVNDSSSINVNGGSSSTCGQGVKLQSNSSIDASGAVILTGEGFSGGNSGEQTDSGWNGTTAVRRLKL
ncbi:unnamed protein product [Heterobilharzia americana]|nr:unnamed protein product [Heterobilharzia americana]